MLLRRALPTALTAAIAALLVFSGQSALRTDATRCGYSSGAVHLGGAAPAPNNSEPIWCGK